MTDLQIYLTLGIFGTVILIIALDLLDMTVAALGGVCTMLAFGILDTGGITSAMRVAGGPLSLLFGGMVVARMLGRTGVFERVGESYLHACAGSGRRFLLLLIALVAPVCALLRSVSAVGNYGDASAEFFDRLVSEAKKNESGPSSLSGRKRSRSGRQVIRDRI